MWRNCSFLSIIPLCPNALLSGLEVKSCLLLLWDLRKDKKRRDRNRDKDRKINVVCVCGGGWDGGKEGGSEGGRGREKF